MAEALRKPYLTVVEPRDFRVIDGKGHKAPNIQKEDRWVDPIRDKDDVRKVVSFLKSEITNAKRADSKSAAQRNLFLFTMGINIGVRVSDLLALTWDQIFEADMKTFKENSGKKEKKTGKIKRICPNAAMKKAVEVYLQQSGVVPEAGHYLFQSGKKNADGTIKNEMLSEMTATRCIKKATEACGIKGNYNTHSIRKTYAYHKYMMLVEAGDPMALVKVQKDLNHRNSSDTARYLGITREDQIESSQQLADYWEM